MNMRAACGRTMAAGTVLLAVIWFTVHAPARPAHAQARAEASPRVHVDNGRLSASLAGTPAGVVFDQIAQQAGFVLVLDPSLRGIPLHTRIDDMHLEDGLRQLIEALGPVSSVLEFVATGD